MQTLFKKIAGALPGMEATSASAKREEMIDVNLKPMPYNSDGDQSGGCLC